MADYIKNQIRLAGVAPESIVDGPGLRFTLFAQGCPFHCAGCHNPHTHDFGGGKIYLISDIIKRIKSNPLLDGVTFSGGEPFCQPEAFLELAERLANEKINGFNIHCYTGYTIEELLETKNADIHHLLSRIDALIDGKFDESKKSYELKFKGSSNQRVLNPKESVKQGKAVFLLNA